MKYLKKFETTIKHSDPIALNHPLRDFSRKLEDMIILLKELDNFKNSTVKRYFTDDGKIDICYRTPDLKLLLTSLQIQDDMIHLRISDTAVRSWNENYIENSLDFFDIVNKELREYRSKSEERVNSSDFTYVRYIFPISKMNDILNDIFSTYEIYTDSIKYNI